MSQRKSGSVLDQVEFPELRGRLQYSLSTTIPRLRDNPTYLVLVADQGHLVIPSQSNVTYIVQNRHTAARADKVK